MDRQTYKKISQQMTGKPKALPLLTHLFFDAVLVGLIYTCISYGYSMANILFVPILMFRMFALMHECVHNIGAPNRKLNDILGILSGALCLLPYSQWKAIHIDHHIWTGNVEMDPTMKIIKDSNKLSISTQKLLNLCWKLWIPAGALSQHIVFWSKSLSLLINEFKNDTKTRHRWVSLSSYVFPLGLYFQFDLLSLLPGVYIYLILVEVVNFPHHLRMPCFNGESRRLPVFEQEKTTRSCVYPAWFASFVLNNFNLHSEHHLFPKAPWYELPKARALLEPYMMDSFHTKYWILKNRKVSFADLIKPNFENTNNITDDKAA